MKTSLTFLLAAVVGSEGQGGTIAPPFWSTNLNAALHFSWAPSGTDNVMIAWEDTLPSPGSCLDRRIVGATASQTGSLLSITSIPNDLVASVGDRTGMCSPMDTDGIQHVSLVQISSTSNAVIYNGPAQTTVAPITTIESPYQQLVSAAGLPSGSSTLAVNKKNKNMMRAVSVSLGTTGYVTCWNRERGSQSKLRVVCRKFNTDGTSAGPKYLIKKFLVTSDEEATSISLVNMQSDGTNGLSVDSFAIGITYFPPSSAAPQLWIGVLSWNVITNKFVIERVVQTITFDTFYGLPKRFDKEAIQIEKSYGSNPTSLVAVYGTGSHVVSQPIEMTGSMSTVLFPFVLGTPEVFSSFNSVRSSPTVIRVIIQSTTYIVITWMQSYLVLSGKHKLLVKFLKLSQFTTVVGEVFVAEEKSIGYWGTGWPSCLAETAPVGNGYILMSAISDTTGTALEIRSVILP